LCAQSFHWFANAASVREFARILKPGGRLALMWNRRSRTDPFTAAYREAVAEVGGESAHETEPFDRDLIAAGGVFSPVERLVFPNAQHLDFDGLLGRARSASYTPKTGNAAARLLDLLRDLHTRYADANGRVTLVYETEVFRSIRR
jgi:SAM-dependent methyltransferase